MRLIDADVFKDWLLNRFAKPQDTLVLTLQGFIAEQPTAYDIDKVVEELEKSSKWVNETNEYGDDDGNDYIPLSKAIEIIKRGGVTDDMCEWRCDEHGNWYTECRYITNNKRLEYTYCPYCGKKIKYV